MPGTSKLGFTKQHYTMKPPHHPINYDPENNTIKVGSSGAGSASLGVSNGGSQGPQVQVSNGGYNGK